MVAGGAGGVAGGGGAGGGGVGGVVGWVGTGGAGGCGVAGGCFLPHAPVARAHTKSATAPIRKLEIITVISSG